ncbi:MAG: hypothetical protein Hyperionvirus2_129 [Hyperionvirus sp.]|uniref:Uncharacterized protein n=1 Tax=Hyperionvirus sp. TaxID=2487770 RepID=A0A3G5A9A0_9VIRU|nr:MAG: hypothetical protein Hyperionvirus2_129 [Hyperionvirus sp.]
MACPRCGAPCALKLGGGFYKTCGAATCLRMTCFTSGCSGQVVSGSQCSVHFMLPPAAIAVFGLAAPVAAVVAPRALCPRCWTPCGAKIGGRFFKTCGAAPCLQTTCVIPRCTGIVVSGTTYCRGHFVGAAAAPAAVAAVATPVCPRCPRPCGVKLRGRFYKTCGAPSCLQTTCVTPRCTGLVVSGITRLCRSHFAAAPAGPAAAAAGPAVAVGTVCGAGALIISDRCLVLGEDQTRSFRDFGGKTDFPGQCPVALAIKETDEETRATLKLSSSEVKGHPYVSVEYRPGQIYRCYIITPSTPVSCTAFYKAEAAAAKMPPCFQETTRMTRFPLATWKHGATHQLSKTGELCLIGGRARAVIAAAFAAKLL